MDQIAHASPPPGLTEAATTVAALVQQVAGEELPLPTPCRDLTVAALLDHLDGLAVAFACAARHEPVPDGQQPDAGRLAPDFRTVVPVRLRALAEAWRDLRAVTGETAIGGLVFPREVIGRIAVDEVVVHGWDLAAALGRAYEPPEDAVAAALGFVAGVVEENPGGTPGLFEAPLAVPDDVDPLERLLRLTGRDPAWSAPRPVAG